MGKGAEDAGGLEMSAGGEGEPKPSKLQQVKSYFTGQGLELTDIPMAIVYHEVIGLAMAAGFWSGCYVTQPSRSIYRMASGLGAKARARAGAGKASAPGVKEKMLGAAEQKIASWKWLQKTPLAKRDPRRLTVSLAESLALRASIKPATFPFKLWASWKLTAGTKQALTRLPFRKADDVDLDIGGEKRPRK